MKYQPRYVAFLRAKGLPDDSDYFDGVEYIAYINKSVALFIGESGISGPLNDAEHDAFTAWLLAGNGAPVQPDKPEPITRRPEFKEIGQ